MNIIHVPTRTKIANYSVTSYYNFWPIFEGLKSKQLMGLSVGRFMCVLYGGGKAGAWVSIVAVFNFARARIGVECHVASAGALLVYACAARLGDVIGSTSLIGRINVCRIFNSPRHWRHHSIRTNDIDKLGRSRCAQKLVKQLETVAVDSVNCLGYHKVKRGAISVQKTTCKCIL